MSNIKVAAFRYLNVPAAYVCSGCKITGVKLWREFGYATLLLCAKCVAPDMKIDAFGKHVAKYDDLSDQVVHPKHGNMMPAVPCEDGTGWWSYTSVPDEGCAWWKHLPTYPEKE